MQQHPLVAILNRLGTFVLVMIALSIMIFVLARVVPGDPARMALGPAATQEQVDALRGQMGLDKPLGVQYLDYIGNALHGDLGFSLVSQRPVTTDLAQTVPATVELVLVSVIFMFLVAIPLGVITAHYRDRPLDISVASCRLPGSRSQAFSSPSRCNCWQRAFSTAGRSSAGSIIRLAGRAAPPVSSLSTAC